MTQSTSRTKILKFIRAFFPIQLLFGHLKYNLFSLFFWFILFNITSDSFGYAFGIPFLFYSPEYQGETSAISFSLIGFAIGGFTIAFHTFSYMKLGKKYPFIVSVPKPFITFCLNNSIIPFVFVIYFMFKFSIFQIREEFATIGDIVIYNLSFLGGFAFFLLISFFYFFPANKKLLIIEDQGLEDKPLNIFLRKKINWSEYFVYKKDRTFIYMVNLKKWKASRSLAQFDKKTLDHVFKITKKRSFVFEIVTVTSFIFFGIFREHPILDLPAGMSIITLLTIIMMIISALMSWFYYWTYPIIIFALILMNFLSVHTSYFQYKNYAYGLSYKAEDLKSYELKELQKHADDQINFNQSRRNYLKTLNSWKKNTSKQKPKLIILLTSGGGSRSALWTFSVLQHLDSTFQNEIFEHTQMITGASGGMVGAAYYRSLVIDEMKKNSSKNYKINSKNSKEISSDLLNRLSFSAYSNDLFFRMQKFKVGNNSYTRDRAFAFEQHLNENTHFLMDKSLRFFKRYEQKGLVPTMIFSPTIVNDGRRLIVSSQSMAFLCSSIGKSSSVNDMYENIDFQTFFKGNNNIRFLSVLRMNATFPLVLPMVSMPTQPEMHVMDAGIRDNYGVKIGMEYLFTLQDWIKENTSGIIFLKIRDTKKILEGETVHKVSLFNKFTLPFGNMYNNFPRTQDFDQDEILKIASYGFNFPIDLVVFNLREDQKDRISLSWHLTKQEKVKIRKALKSKGNQHSLEQLKMLMK